MSSQKLPDEIDLETLISALEKSETTEKFEDNDVVLFMTHYDLKSGDNCTTGKLLYDLYKLWTRTPVSMYEFGEVLRRFIPIKDKYYFINKSALKISSTLYSELQKNYYDRSRSHKYQKHFENFINKYKLTKGDNWIHTHYIYYLYDVWVYKIQKTNPMRKSTFSHFLNIYFQKKITLKGTFYGFGDTILEHLTPEVKQQIDEGISYRSEKRKKAKEAKNKSKNEE